MCRPRKAVTVLCERDWTGSRPSLSIGSQSLSSGSISLTTGLRSLSIGSRSPLGLFDRLRLFKICLSALAKFLRPFLHADSSRSTLNQVCMTCCDKADRCHAPFLKKKRSLNCHIKRRFCHQYNINIKQRCYRTNKVWELLQLRSDHLVLLVDVKELKGIIL